MTRDEFEKLLSDGLDDPADVQLRARIEEEISRAPELDRVRGDWMRLNVLIRAGQIDLASVDFANFVAGVQAAIAESREDHALERVLAESTAIEDAIDWERYGTRVRAALHAAGAPASRSRRVIRFAFGLSGLAAAAAIALLFVAPWLRTPSPQVKQVLVFEVTRLEEGGPGQATVAVTRSFEMDESAAPSVSVSVSHDSFAMAPPEKSEPALFLSISAARPAAESGASGIY